MEFAVRPFVKRGKEEGGVHFGVGHAFRREDGEDRYGVDVRFSGVSFVAREPAGTGGIETVWSRFLGQVSGPCARRFEDHVVLNDLSGELEAGTATLLLGAPSAGKSSFLKTLCGRLDVGSKSKLTGEIAYNNIPQNKLDVMQVATFVDDIDVHLPLLDVEQTFKFACETMGQDLSRVDDVIESLGLNTARNTIVGNTFIRGISGGERKRVTVGEMLFGRNPLLVLDEVTTGLDAATAFDIVEILVNSTKNMNTTMIASLLQPEPRVVELFDQVILMVDGSFIYHGPVSLVEDYFRNLGYENVSGRSIGEFLVDLTSIRRLKYFGGPPEELHTTAALVEAFKSQRASPKKIDVVGAKSAPEFYRRTSGGYRYRLSQLDDLRVVFKRQLILFRTDFPVTLVLLLQSLVISLVAGVLFYDLPFRPSGPGDVEWIRSRTSMIFFITLLFALGAFSLLPLRLIQRNVFYKQQQARMLRTGTFVLASTFTQVLVSIVDTALVVCIIFFMTQVVDVDAPDSIEVFFLLYLISLGSNLSTNAFATLLGYMSPNLVFAFLVNTLSMAAISLFAGFVVTEDSVVASKGWLWLFWLNPASWAFRSSMILVFRSESFAENDIGLIALQQFGLRRERIWVSMGIVYLFFFFILATLGQFIVLKFVRAGRRTGRRGYVRGQKAEEEEEAKLFSGRAAEDDYKKTLLPCPAVNLSFNRLFYKVKVKHKEKVLLTNISGRVLNGRLTAIVGMTGSGKSTLLDVLAKRKTQGRVSGHILVDGKVLDKVHFQRIIAYVEQDDYHTPSSSVREAVDFSQALRLPKHVEKDERVKFVDGILRVLDLEDIEGARIGEKGGKDLSGGQLKRLSLAVELAANPSILFVDEPTSGLDASQAEMVAHAMKRLSEAGRTLMVSIHQPSTQVIDMFDDVILLETGGRVAYAGPLDELLGFFSRIPENRNPIPEGECNVATYALETLGAGIYGNNIGDDFDFGDFWENSEEHRRMIESIRQEQLGSRNKDDLDRENAVDALTAQLYVLRRFVVTYWRTPEYNLIRVELLLIIHVFLGLTFVNEGRQGITEVTKAVSVLGLLFFAALFSSFLTALTSLTVTLPARAVFYRESFTKVYNPAMLVFGSTISEIPHVAAAAFVSAGALYACIGLQPGVDAFLKFFLLYFVFLLSMTFNGHLMSSITPGLGIAVVLTVGLTAMFALFSGFMIAEPLMPEYLSWIYLIDPFGFVLNGIANNQFFCNCEIDPETSLAPVPTCNSGQSCETVCNPEALGCDFLNVPTESGVFVITVWSYMRQTFGFIERPYFVELGIMVLYAIAFRVLDIAALSFLRFHKR